MANFPNLLNVISTIAAVISVVFAWAAYRFALPRLLIKVFYDFDSVKTLIKIEVENIGGRDTTIDSKLSYFEFIDIENGNLYRQSINLRKIDSNIFSTKIEKHGGKLASSYLIFNQPIQINQIIVHDVFLSRKWKLKKSDRIFVNNLLLQRYCEG